MAEYEPTFSSTDEQDALREIAVKWFADRSAPERVRTLMATDEGFDQAEWAESCAMGWAALPVPEELGGAGMGWTEAAVIAEGAGAALWCAPWLSSAVLATAALLAARGEVADELLPALASGETRATLCLWADEAITTDGATVTGTARAVLDGATADVLLVACHGPDGPVLLAVDADADGVTAVPQPVLDLTRKLAEVTFAGAAGRVVATGDAAHAAVERARTVGAVLLTVEQVGGAGKVLADSVEYGRTRMQFGRAIGSYQALKHRMADTLKEVEAARSAAYHAVRVLDSDDADELAVAAPVAVSYCGGVYERAAGANIQNHGGIGFTWEHDAHLYFKRAKSSKLLFGGPSTWRDQLGRAIGI